MDSKLNRPEMLRSPKVLTGISHELRTHMNAVVAFSYLMKEESCSSVDREEFGNQILNACEELIDLFDSILDSAVIDTGNLKIDQKIFRFDNFLDELFSDFRAELKKEKNKNIELVTEIQYSNSFEFVIDKNKVYRIIRSLFQNSLMNTMSGYIKIGYFLKDEKVTFYVMDSGQGYTKCKELLENPDFDESMALHNDTFSMVNLALAKKLIRLLNGTVSVECNGLNGTAVYFSLPTKRIISSNIGPEKMINTRIAI